MAPSTGGRSHGSVPVIAVTGVVAAGKSEALAAFARQGAETLSADAVVAQLLSTPEVRAALVERFGNEVAPDGTLDRSAVARVVFADPSQREWLESLLWPRVADEIRRWRASVEARSCAPKALVVEVPLVFEAGMEHNFDAIVAVVASEDTRAKRLGDRGDETAERRASQQLSQEEKSQRADFAVSNDASLEDLEAKVAQLLAIMAT